jgi:hypothetical protein
VGKEYHYLFNTCNLFGKEITKKNEILGVPWGKKDTTKRVWMSEKFGC